MNNEPNWSTEMNLMNEELARAQMAARLGEAQTQQRRRRPSSVPPR
jgi:hypothetical protein